MRQPRWVAAIERALHVRRNMRGINRFPDPYAYFGAGGVAEAEALCDEANRDLLARRLKRLGYEIVLAEGWKEGDDHGARQQGPPQRP